MALLVDVLRDDESDSEIIGFKSGVEADALEPIQLSACECLIGLLVHLDAVMMSSAVPSGDDGLPLGRRWRSVPLRRLMSLFSFVDIAQVLVIVAVVVFTVIVIIIFWRIGIDD